MALEAELRPSAAEALTGAHAPGDHYSLAVGHDSIPARDLATFKRGIVDEFAGKIMKALDESGVLRMMVKAASLRFARHVNEKGSLNITHPAVGTILQEIFLRVGASLSG